MSWAERFVEAEACSYAFNRVRHARCVADLPEGHVGGTGVGLSGWNAVPDALRPLVRDTQMRGQWRDSPPEWAVEGPGVYRVVERRGGVYRVSNERGSFWVPLPPDTAVRVWAWED